MKTFLIIFLVIMILGVLIGVPFLLIYSKKLKEQVKVESDTGTELKEGGLTTQQFLPFKTIERGIVDLGNHEYRVYIECTSVNYLLKTSGEQEILEKTFQRFINSFNFPFAFYIQTREIDSREIIKNVENDVKKISHTFPQLQNYANQYLSDIVSLNERLSNTKQRKKYIIVTYDDANNLTELSDEEKADRAKEQIILRANTVIQGLSSIGIRGNILNQREVVELIFRALNKEAVGALDGIVDGDFLTPIVRGGKTFANSHPAAKLDILLANFLDSVQTELMQDNSIDPNFKKTIERTYNEVSSIRDKYSGYYKGGN